MQAQAMAASLFDENNTTNIDDNIDKDATLASNVDSGAIDDNNLQHLQDNTNCKTSSSDTNNIQDKTGPQTNLNTIDCSTICSGCNTPNTISFDMSLYKQKHHLKAKEYLDKEKSDLKKEQDIKIEKLDDSFGDSFESILHDHRVNQVAVDDDIVYEDDSIQIDRDNVLNEPIISKNLLENTQDIKLQTRSNSTQIKSYDDIKTNTCNKDLAHDNKAQIQTSIHNDAIAKDNDNIDDYHALTNQDVDDSLYEGSNIDSLDEYDDEMLLIDNNQYLDLDVNAPIARVPHDNFVRENNTVMAQDGNPKLVSQETRDFIESSSSHALVFLNKAVKTPDDFYLKVKEYDPWYQDIIKAGYTKGPDYAVLTETQRVIDKEHPEHWTLIINNKYSLMTQDPNWLHNITTKFAAFVMPKLSIDIELINGVPQNCPYNFALNEYLNAISKTRNELDNSKLKLLLDALGEDLNSLQIDIYKSNANKTS